MLDKPLQMPTDRASALQKYLLLNSQREALWKRLESISRSPSSTTSMPSSPAMSSSSPLTASFPTTYYNQQRYLQHLGTSYANPLITPVAETLPEAPSQPASAALQTRRSSLPATPWRMTSSPSELEGEELKLINVNQEIKATLTDLLNCESVRNDKQFRMWIQTRLMDAERELKNSRSLSRERRQTVNMDKQRSR